MARDISVSIAVQGEREFNQALRNAQSAVKVLSSELKASEAAFDENADAQAYYATRTRIINAQIEQERTILKSLEQAVREAGEEFGEASSKTDKYRIEINRTYESIAKMERALRETQREAEELGRDSTRVGRQISNGIGDAADDAADDLDNMVRRLETNLGDIGSAVEFSALSDLGGMIGEGINVVVSGVSNLTEGTVDFRRQMAILEQNAQDMGFDPDWLKQQAGGIAALTGDMDGAIEAVSNLARVAPDVDSFTTVMDRLLGATIAWPETFKIENLAESLQESLASGQITGAYSELMSRLGLDIDTINKSFAEAAKKGQDALWTAGTAWTSEHGFEETIENFREMNADLIAYQEAKIKLTQAEADLADKLTPAATAGIEFLTDLVNGLTGLIAHAEGLRELKDKEWSGVEEVAAAIADNGELGKQVEEIEKGIAEAYEDGNELLAEELKKSKDELMVEVEQAQQDIAEKLVELTSPMEKTPNQGILGFLIDGEMIEEEAQSAVDALSTGVEEAAQDDEGNMETIGKNIGTSIINGMVETVDEVSAAAAGLFNAIKDELTKETITIPSPKIEGGYEYDSSGTLKGGGKGGSSHVELVAQIEKTTVARAVYDDVDSMMGAQADYYSTYG